MFFGNKFYIFVTSIPYLTHTYIYTHVYVYVKAKTYSYMAIIYKSFVKFVSHLSNK